MEINRKLIKKTAKAALNQNYGGALFAAVLPGAISTVISLAGSGVIYKAFTGAVRNAYGLSGLSYDAFISSNTPASVAYMFTEPEVLAATMIPVAVMGIVSALFACLILAPLQAGIAGFYSDAATLKQNPEITSLFRQFRSRNVFKNTVICSLIVNIIIYLWSLLLFVPGVVAGYTYLPALYLLSTRTEMSRKEVMSASKAMMKGLRGKAFFLDLSFVPWYILGTLTMGILTLFFVVPYHSLARAAFYNTVAGRQQADAPQEVPAPHKTDSHESQMQGHDMPGAAEGNINSLIKEGFIPARPLDEQPEAVVGNAPNARILASESLNVSKGTVMPVGVNSGAECRYLGKWKAYRAQVGEEYTDNPANILGKDMSFIVCPEGELVFIFGDKTKICEWDIPEEGLFRIKGFKNFIFTEIDNNLILGFEGANIYFSRY